MKIGAVIAPLLTGRQQAYEQAQQTAAQATAAADAATSERYELAEQLATSETARDDMEPLLEASEAELDAAQTAIAAAMESKATFEMYEDTAGKYRWRLRHRNGRIIAHSGEGFGKRGGAVASIERIKRHAPAAEQE